MFCKECGKQVIESDMFCKNCGTPVKIEADHLSKSEEGAKIHEDAQEIGITGQDESSKQSEVTKQIEVTVPIEATDIDASKQTVKKKSVKEKKNKKPKGKMFKLIIPVVVLVGIIIFSFYSIYAQTTDYSGMQGRATSSWQLYNERVYDNEDENLTINIDIEDLNAYINDKDILSEIKIDGFKIQSVCFSTEEEEVYMNVKKGSSPPVDIIADYELHVVNDSLILNLKPSSIGLNVPIISTITLATKYDIRLLEIPMNSSLEEIDNQFMVSLLAGQDLIPKLKRKEFILEYSLEDVLVNEEAINISEATIEEPVVIHEGDIQYVSIQQGYLVGKVLQDVSVIQLLKEKDIEGDYYIGKNQELYLRAKDNISGANYDLELIFSYELEEDALILETVKGAKGSVLDEALVTTLYEAYGSVFMSNRPDVLDKYKIISVSTEDNDLRFQVDQASWTILIYMNGSDLESSYYNGGLLGSGTNDLNEMMTGLVSDSVQVVIETGGTLEWVMPEIDASQNQRWAIDNGDMSLLQNVGLKNMTDPATLENFLNWGIETYPSENYALLFWDHGGGSLYGFGYDEYFYDDSLTLDEIDSALSNVKDKQDVTYEVVGFDACLMATLETAKMLEPYANYLIASEETEPDYGWDYTRIFSDLSNGLATDGESFGEIVVSGFMVDSIDKNAEEMLTLSVIDLSKITAVVDSVDALFAAIGTNSYEYGYDSLSKVIPQIKAFGGNTEYSGYTDHYDLENLAKKLTEFWPGEANAVMTAIDDAVVYKIAGYLATDAGGISLYLPYYDLYVDDISAAYDPVSFSTGYADFVSDYVDYRLDTFTNNTDFDYVLNTEVDPYQITFGPEYIDYISALYLNVYIVDDTVDGYYYTDLGMDAWVYPTDDPYTWEEGFYRWASLGDWYVPLFVTYENDDYIEYETPILLNGEYVTLVSAWVYDEDSYIVYGARPSIESGGGIQDRNTIEFEEGDEIILLYDIYDMNSSDVYESYSDPYYVDASGVPRFEDFDFGTGFTYAVQFVIQDYNGTYTYTEPLEFSYDD